MLVAKVIRVTRIIRVIRVTRVESPKTDCHSAPKSKSYRLARLVTVDARSAVRIGLESRPV